MKRSYSHLMEYTEPYKLAVTSVSLGRARFHSIREKLLQASRHGIQGIELFYEDLEHLASSFPGGAISTNILLAAHHIRKLCDSLDLTVINLQPFMFYEGLLDRSEHDRIINEKLPLWFGILRILGSDTILIPSNFLPPDPTTGQVRITGNIDVIVSDLTEMADLGARQSPPVKFAYEALAWGTFVDTWEAAWDIVCRVNRPNFGIGLDTFNIAGRIYGDPTSLTRKTRTAELDFHLSMLRMSRILDPGKIFSFQLADAEYMARPLSTKHPFHVEGQPSRMSWSRNARLFPFERGLGAYLPVLEVVKTVLNLGYTGWISMEVFSTSLASPEAFVPLIQARRALDSWEILIEEIEGPAATESLEDRRCAPRISGSSPRALM
ncbi:hypothetical protein DTO027B5_7084 [Paecilomyces variotii]|nr:hypothetical protein DTO169C6_5901 [Paecilomyces variotii]KAJ9285264.1 hypothetical protein DTO021C3_7182 [Paecilomyces variotii]KAJ9321491.1 hypothetical protein DTO027B3_7524 [Paecilomyces variotii]KAJ9331121.1 hypothetical protein DTO027B5_7084 [Paecilomyces variotii]KAJ9373169.1 hypothetical protein DTO282E5_2236 [Paecilomyces variotii]